MDILFLDTGLGMTQDKVDAVLKGFVATDKGSGLGVLLSKVSTEVQDGTFDLKSTAGVGTRIMIQLPMAPEEER